MSRRALVPGLFVSLLLSLFGVLSCGSSGGSSTTTGTDYTDKCRRACDSSAVMVCATMDSATCQGDCKALVSGLSALCATCVTQNNAWQFELDQRSSGAAGCRGYGFPSVTATNNGGCGNACTASTK